MMNARESNTPRHQKRLSVIFYRSLRRRAQQLPVSFYLILAIIAALLLGVTGFSDLNDPRRLAFTTTLFVIFFGAVIYRALLDAVDIYRDYHRQDVSLISDVLDRDGFSKRLREKTGSERPRSSNASESDA